MLLVQEERVYQWVDVQIQFLRQPQSLSRWTFYRHQIEESVILAFKNQLTRHPQHLLQSMLHQLELSHVWPTQQQSATQEVETAVQLNQIRAHIFYHALVVLDR